MIGAFFDKKLSFLQAIRSTWPSAEVVVGIEPDTVYLPVVPEDSKIRFVDVRTLWTEDKGKYLHAKAVYLEGIDAQRIFISGSANPSGAGWGLGAAAVNTQAMVLVRDSNALDALSKTGLIGLFDLPELTVEELKFTAARTNQSKLSIPQTAPRIVVGTANEETRLITITFPDAKLVRAIVVLDDRDGLMPLTFDFVVNGHNIEIVFGESVGAIRSLLLRDDAVVLARVVVHHTGIVNATSTSTRQNQI